MRINLTDNTVKDAAKTYALNDVAALLPIANKTIDELCGDKKNLLIFPQELKDTKDKIKDSPVLNIKFTEDAQKVKITTGNVMGFIGVGNLQVKIQSRFDEGRDDYLLHYMLQRVMSFNFFDLSHDNEQEDVFDFIMFMFPYFLKGALRQGIYREYQTYRHNDANIKGVIDIGRHIARNIPFAGKIAYSTREYSHDNSMTELIRHTIEFMKTKKYGQEVLCIDEETVKNVASIIECTPLYNKNERNNIINKNLRKKTHPYYTEYNPLQTLCIQILRMEEVKYGESEDKVWGILFDGAWLWEAYVNTILEKQGFKHPDNINGTGGYCIFTDGTGRRYPDFYKKGFVLDAKYKRLGSYDKVSDVGRDDVHQLFTYMTTKEASRGGFVAPLTENQPVVPTSIFKVTGTSLSIFGIEVSKISTSYAEFCQDMKEKEKIFVESLKKKMT